MRKHWAACGLIAAAMLTASAAHAQFTQRWVTTLPFHQQMGQPTNLRDTPYGDTRGIAFNRNPDSPYYGYAYLCFLSKSDGTRVDTINIYRPDTASAAHGVPSYIDTGYTIKAPVVGNGQNQAFGVDIGSDDTVWLVDYANRTVMKAPPVPTLPATQADATVVINLADHDAAATALLPSGITPGQPRAITVSGPATNATIVVCNWASSTKRSIEHFTVTDTGTTFDWAYAPQNVAGNASSQANTCVDAALDSAGNVYVPLAAAGGEVSIVKLSAAGVVDTSFTPTAPAATGSGDSPAIAYVPNASAPGGGYLFWSGRPSTVDIANFYQYEMTGSLVAAYGVDAAGSPLSLGSAIVQRGAVEVLSADEAGNLYHRRSGSPEGVVYRISLSPPAISAGDYKKSAPTAYNGVLYFGSNDGNLHAVDTTTGEEADGWPVNIATLTTDTGATVTGRPSVRIAGGDTAYVYAATNTGRVIRVPLTGTLGTGGWVSAPLVTATDVKVTPAVADTGVYVAMADGTAATLFKLDLNTGDSLYSVPLTGATSVQSSISAFGNALYVGTDAKAFRVTDDGSALVVQSDVGGSTPGSPFVDVAAPDSPTMYSVDATGVVYARNATTFNPVTAFGGGSVTLPVGTVQATYPNVSTGPYALNGKVYVGANDNKVYALYESDGSGAGTGNSMVFFDASAVGIPVTETVPGGWKITSDVSAAPASGGGFNLVFGSRDGLYYQVKADDPAQYHVTVVGNVNRYAVDSAPAIDRATTSEFVGVDSGYIMKVPAF